MPDPYDQLRSVPLFDGLADDDLRTVCRAAGEVRLQPGEVLFREAEPGEHAYVITAGEVEITKATDRREVLLALRRAGEVIGEMALLQEEPRVATARARTPSRAVSIPRTALDDLLARSPAAARTVFQTVLARLRATNDQLRQSERLVQLGTLTAGVAHELNNPAAAVSRAATRMVEETDALASAVATDIPPSLRAAAMALADRFGQGPVDALERSDAETAVDDWLDANDVPASSAPAADVPAKLVDAGIAVTDLDRLRRHGSGDDLAAALALVVSTTTLRQLGRDVAAGAGRISTIVRALKSYAFLDQAPVQDVDVHRGLDDALTLLAHRTREVHVVREFDHSVPTITALGTELSQVWTNLIENACDALEDVYEPTLILRTRSDDSSVIVEVEDNGPGVPDTVRARIFDAFFTTKPPGKGTGLGLQISYRIVVLEHRGDLTVESRPGRTTFRVTLPVQAPTKGG